MPNHMQSEQLRQRWSASASSSGVTAEMGMESPFFFPSTTPTRNPHTPNASKAKAQTEEPLLDFADFTTPTDAPQSTNPLSSGLAGAAGSGEQELMDIRAFVSAQCVFASPLTRAVQVCTHCPTQIDSEKHMCSTTPRNEIEQAV